jgi:multidrug efflux pump subunit AcrB
MASQEINSRTAGRFTSIEEIARLPIEGGVSTALVRVRDVAEVIDGLQDEKLRIGVVDAVKRQLDWLGKQRLVPEDIKIEGVSDQSIYVRQSLANATTAAASGAFLAMLVVYLFLGDLRRTLIIGTGIPIMVALILMATTGLTLNIMTLGGLALGVGMLVDNTIVMLENIYRHQRMGKSPSQASGDAAAEVNSAIVASTSTNLAAVLPFLFIGGLIGLLFRELA